MALCLKKFFKKVGSISYTNLRKHVSFYQSQRVSTASAPALNEVVNPHYLPVNAPSHYYLSSQLIPAVHITPCDIIIWDCCVPKSDEAIFRYYFQNDKSDILKSLENEMAQCVKECRAYKQDKAPNNLDNQGRPSEEQLQKIFNNLSNDLPNLFGKSMNFSIYHKDLIFENNIRGTVTKGLIYYIQQISLLKVVGHLKFAYVSMDILKITAHPEEGSVKVRWRIKGLSSFKVMVTFWKTKLWNTKDSIDKSEKWYDGFSTFYVNDEGLIYKHIVDKMMPDSNDDTTLKPQLAAKVALILGLAPRDLVSASDASAIVENDFKLVSNTMLPLEELE